MAPEAKNENLLYISDSQRNDVRVYTYPQGRLVGTLTGFGQPRSECVDKAGDVWIADVEAFDVSEYRHGGTAPIVALSTPGRPTGCSVDPTTGNLAVSGGVNGIVVSVFPASPRNRFGDAQTYTDPGMGEGYFCGFDGTGNLYVDGINKISRGRFKMAELPRGGTALTRITLNQKIKTPGQVQWDGKYVAVGDSGAAPSVIHQVSIAGGSGTIVSSTELDGAKDVEQFWVQGKRVVAPDFENDDVGFWSYPAGGSPTKTITGVHGYGAAVSLAK
jgi:hypothetical protein